MKEKTVLPVVVVALVGALVLTLGLWAMNASNQTSATAVEGADRSLERFEWKLVTTWPKGLPGLGTAPENFARRVNAMSDGRLSVRVYGAGEVVPPSKCSMRSRKVSPKWGMAPPIIGKEKFLRRYFLPQCHSA